MPDHSVLEELLDGELSGLAGLFTEGFWGEALVAILGDLLDHYLFGPLAAERGHGADNILFLEHHVGPAACLHGGLHALDVV